MLMEEGTNYMPNKVFFDIDCIGNYINPLQKKAETRKNDSCIKPTVFR